MYRQHLNNDTGAKKFSVWRTIKNRLLGRTSHTQKKFNQAQHFYEKYHHLLSSTQKETLQFFCSLKNTFFKQEYYRLIWALKDMYDK